MAIKGVLKEELSNSLRLKKRYEEELSRLPRGSLVRKNIKGHFYYYILLRDGKKVKFIYKGKTVDKNVLKNYTEAKRFRAKYRGLLSRLKKQITFLRGTLRGKEAL